MDTAQRGMGLGWPEARELIARSLKEAARPRRRADRLRRRHRPPRARARTSRSTRSSRAYEEQVEAIEALGGRIILMASRALAAAAKSPDDYAKVYGRILSQMKEPVVLHWLGEMFDPALAGYWGQPTTKRRWMSAST